MLLRPLSAALALCLSLPAAAGWVPIGTPDFDGTVYDVVEFRGELVAAGSFVFSGTTRVDHIARFDGQRWLPLGEGLQWDDPAKDPYKVWVSSLLVHDDRLWVAGDFRRSGEVPLRQVGTWDGSQWAPAGPGFNAIVYDLDVFRGEVVAAGNFTRTGDRPVRRVAQWRGGEWRDLDGGMRGTVHSLEVHGDLLFAGGLFDTAGDGRTMERVAFWDGTIWMPGARQVRVTDLRPQLVLPTVLDFASHAGELVMAGLFDQIDGRVVHSIARREAGEWIVPEPAGARPLTTLDRVFSVASFDGELYLGGLVDDGNLTNPIRYLARLEGDRWRPLEGGVDDHVQVLLPVSDGLVVGGSFRRAGAIKATGIAKWKNTGVGAFVPELAFTRGPQGPRLVIAAMPDGPRYEVELRVLRRSGALEETVARLSWSTRETLRWDDPDPRPVPAEYTVMAGAPFDRSFGPFTVGASVTALSLRRLPDGADGEVRFDLRGAAAGEAEVAFYDARGRRVWSATLPTSDGGSTIEWSGVDGRGRGVAAGVYRLEVRAGDRRAMARVLRLR